MKQTQDDHPQDEKSVRDQFTSELLSLEIASDIIENSIL